MTWVEPLALQTLFMNLFAGSIEIFTFVSMIAIAFLSAKFRMPASVMMLIFGLYVLILNTYLNFGGLYVLVILMAGLITFFSMKKLWE